MQNRRAHKIDIHLTGYSMPYLSEYIRKTPFVQELKIRVWDAELDDIYIFELLEVMKGLKYLKKIYMNFSFKFEHSKIFNLLVENFSKILVETSIESSGYFADNSDYLRDLSKFSGLKTLTIYNSTRTKTWLRKVANSTPNLSKLYLIRFYNTEFDFWTINSLLKLWPNIRFILNGERDITSRYDFSFFKPHFRSMYKQQPLDMSMIQNQYWSNEMVYSRDYKCLLLSRANNLCAKLPKNIENLFFIDHPNRRDIISVRNQLKAILWENKQIKSLRTNVLLMEDNFMHFMLNAVCNPGKSYLLGDLASNWLYSELNIQSNSRQMMNWFKYGPKNAINNNIFP